MGAGTLAQYAKQGHRANAQISSHWLVLTIPAPAAVPQHENSCFPSADQVPGAALSILHVTDSILTTTHSMEEEAKTQRG